MISPKIEEVGDFNTSIHVIGITSAICCYPGPGLHLGKDQREICPEPILQGAHEQHTIHRFIDKASTGDPGIKCILITCFRSCKDLIQQ